MCIRDRDSIAGNPEKIIFLNPKMETAPKIGMDIKKDILKILFINRFLSRESTSE